MSVELVSTDDQASLEAWFSPVAAADRADWPADPGWLFHERVALLDQPGVRSHVLGIARLGGFVAGCFQVRLELVENLDTADLEVWVDPAWQHRGVGRTLLCVAEREARARGRNVLVGTTEAPVGSPEAVRRARFARAAGYEPALAEVRRELDLPVDPGLLHALDAEARRAAGYRLVAWTGRCPEEWEAGRVNVAARMSTDVPAGDLQVEPEVWDVERLRQLEGVVEAMDRTAFATAAIAPDGELVAFTELGVPRSAPRVAYQFDTIVLPPHRGHRLGLLVKVANVRSLQDREPATRKIVTTNAASNDPMTRVNHRLGFRLTGTGTVWHKRLE